MTRPGAFAVTPTVNVWPFGIKSAIFARWPRDKFMVPSRSRKKAKSALADVDAVLQGQGFESSRIALPDSSEFPIAAMTVEFSEYHGGFGRIVFGQIEANHLLVIVTIDDANEGIADLPEILPARLGV